MTIRDDYFDLKRRCAAYAIRRGFQEEADDFASYVLEKYSKGDPRPYLRTSFIDYLRITFGDSRPDKKKQNARYEALFESIDDHFDLAYESVESFLNPNVSGRLRIILILSFQWGFSQREVAHVLGVSEPVISVELKGLSRKTMVCQQIAE